jgi:hypothetical protein
MLYDNTGIAVAEITGDGERKPTEEFSRLKSHYLFEAKFGRHRLPNSYRLESTAAPPPPAPY